MSQPEQEQSQGGTTDVAMAEPAPSVQLAPPIEPTSAPVGVDISGEAGFDTATQPTTIHVAHPTATSTLDGHQVKVFQPSVASGSSTSTAANAGTTAEVDESFFEPTLADVQAHHASVLARSKQLNDAPLLTAKYRDEERARKEKVKAEKWPETTIRMKFSDGTQIQSTFPSTSPIQPVYQFVRSALDPSASSKPFVLWQPPRFTYPERPPPQAGGAGTKKPIAAHGKTRIVAPAGYGPIRGGPTQGLMGGTGGRETLNELGLVPQSVLLVRWEDDAMNATGCPAPLLPDLLKKSEPLPPAVPKQEGSAAPSQSASTTGRAPAAGGEKKMPKWLQKGLMKKK